MKVATLLGFSRGLPCTGIDWHTGGQCTTGPARPTAEQRRQRRRPEGAHQHHVLIPEKMRRLKPGDRVLVAWVQSEAVVVDIICPAEDLKK